MRKREKELSMEGGKEALASLQFKDNDVDERYNLLAKIGSGGMGDVFLAVQKGAVEFSRLVVLKRIHDRQAQYSGQFDKMFINEASVIASLNHPHIVKAYDFCTIGSSICIIMEYIEGETLKYILSDSAKKGRRIPIGITCRLILDACDALHYAHNSTSPTGEKKRVVHRDIGLHNLMLDSNGYLKIIDFGIAKSNIETDLTVPGLVKGNPAYMAPDVLAQPDPDHRIDIYALGLCLYEMATQKRAFKFDVNAPFSHIIREINTKRLSLPSEIVPDLPKGLDDVILKAVEKDRTQRYQTIEAFAKDLKRVTERSLMTGSEIKAWFTSEFSNRLKERRAFGAQMLDLARRGAVQQPNTEAGPNKLSTAQFNMNSITPGQPSTPPRPSLHTTQVIIERTNLYKLVGAILLFFALSVLAVYVIMQRDRGAPPSDDSADNLFVTCTPSDSTVTIDDKELGILGEGGLSLHVAPNKPHRIILSKEGYRKFELPFIGPAEGSKRIEAELVKIKKPPEKAGILGDEAVPAAASEPVSDSENDGIDAEQFARKKTSRVSRKKAVAEKTEKKNGSSKPTDLAPAEDVLNKETNRKIPLPDDDDDAKIPVVDEKIILD